MRKTPFVLRSTAAAALTAAAVVGFAAPPAAPTKPAPAKSGPSPAKTPATAPKPGPNGLLPTEYLPTSQLHGGMTGYGLTVFRGNQIEKFDVTVLGVMHRVNSGRDLVLVKLGGPNMQRVTDVVAGMSGSPVYINGRLIGAVSYGMRFTREAMGYVTPIEDMLDSWDPNLPQSPNLEAPSSPLTPASASRSTSSNSDSSGPEGGYPRAGVAEGPRDRPFTAGHSGTPAAHVDIAGHSVSLATPIAIDGRTYRRLRFAAPGVPVAPPAPDEMVAQPCLTPVSVAGISRGRFPKVAEALRKLGLDARQGLGTSVEPGLKGSALVPGGAVAMSLVTGDIDMSGIGTVTYRRGDRIVAFGHPFLGIGPVDAPMFTAYIHDLLPSFSESEKIGSPVQLVGAFSQDRPYSIGGKIGVLPTMVPVTVHVDDRSIGHEHTYHFSVVRHPTITSVLGPSSVSSVIDNAHGMPGNCVATVDTQITADEVGTIHHTNRVFDAADIGEAATEDLQTVASLLSSNSFYPVMMRSIKVDVTIDRGRRTAQVERVFLPQTHFEPGDTIEVGVVLKPYKQERVYKTMHVRIPPTTQPGTLMLTVQGGPTGGGAVHFGGLTFLPTGNADMTLSTNISQLLRRFEERERNDDLVARLTMANTVVNVGGEKFSGLPPNLESAMRSSTRTSGIMLERDEIKTSDRTDYVLSGAQSVPIRVVRHGQPADTSYASPNYSTQPGNSTPNTPNTPAGAPAAAPDPDRYPRDSAEMQTSTDSVAATEALALQRDAPPVVIHAGPPDTGAGTPSASPTTPAPSASVAPTSGPPLVGRQPGIWRQAAADFRLGTLDGATLTSTGELRLAPRLAPIVQTTQPYFWCLAEGPNNMLYAGSGDDGTIYQVGDGKASVFARTGEVEVQSLVRAADGTLYAGTAPNGRIFRIGADGKPILYCQIPDRYVLALGLARDGKTLYAATGGESGRVYALPTDGMNGTTPPPPICTTDEGSITALTVAPDGSVYAGTAPNGLVLKVAGPGGAPMGRVSILYDARESSVSGLVVGADNALYAATAPRGAIYRIGASESIATRTVYDHAPNTGSLVGLVAGPDGTLYTATGSTVIAVDPQTGVAHTFDAPTDIQILSLLPAADGHLLISTGNTAGISRLQTDDAAAGPGTLVSAVLDTQAMARWGQIRWTAATPPGTAITLETRTGSTAQPDADWSGWSGPYRNPAGATIVSPAARYLQYRATLTGASAGASATTPAGPALSAVDIYYLTPNQPPQVTLVSPHAGDTLRGTATVRWSGSDPDRDTLSYTVSISADGGATWRPLNVPGSLNVHPTAPTPAATTTPTPTAGQPDPLADLMAELDRHPEISAETRARIIADAPTASTEPPAPSLSPTPTTDTTRATDFPLDTTAFPDGVYRLRVTVTDRPSNPVGALTDEKVSPEFRIANHAPRLVLFRHSMTIQADRSVRLEGIAIGETVAIRGVQFRIDGGDWQAAAAEDGIFDSPTEMFTVLTLPLPPGHHVIDVQVVDEAGNSSTGRVEAGE